MLLFVSNPLAILNSESAISLYNKFIQGPMEINPETLHSPSGALSSLKGQHKKNCILSYKFN